MRTIDYPACGQEEALRGLWQAAFGDSPEFIGGFFDTAYCPRRCRCVCIDGAVSAALYWLDTSLDDEKYAYLYAVATRPEDRGRGLCRCLMADTHSLLRELGYAGALLTPAEPGLRRMYAGMGYRDCCSVSEIACTAGEPGAIRRIGREEYGVLRRKYLPEGGIVQEGENLAYLEHCASLYAGMDFLLAASAEGGRLRGLELLGSIQAAPGILGALGYKEGTFRIPGTEIPFTMLKVLKAGAPKPKYFGLAFD